MFTIIAAIVFSTAFLVAAATIVWMVMAYHDKMVAALLFQPIPQTAVVYHIHVRRPRIAGLGDSARLGHKALPNSVAFA